MTEIFTSHPTPLFITISKQSYCFFDTLQPLSLFERRVVFLNWSQRTCAISPSDCLGHVCRAAPHYGRPSALENISFGKTDEKLLRRMGQDYEVCHNLYVLALSIITTVGMGTCFFYACDWPWFGLLSGQRCSTSQSSRPLGYM